MRRFGALVATLLLAGAAHAQTISPFGRHSVDFLTEEDRHLAEEASAKIFKQPSPQIGMSENWSNAKTGNHGTVTLVGLREYRGLPCRTLRHTIDVKSRSQPVEFVLDRCRTDDGQWKLL